MVRSQVPQRAVLCPFHLAPPLGPVAGPLQGSEGKLQLVRQSCAPKHTWQQRVGGDCHTEGKPCSPIKDYLRDSRMRAAPKSLGSGAPGTDDCKLFRAPVLVSLGTANSGKSFLGKFSQSKFQPCQGTEQSKEGSGRRNSQFPLNRREPDREMDVLQKALSFPADPRPVPAQPLTYSVTLGKSLFFSEPWFLHL